MAIQCTCRVAANANGENEVVLDLFDGESSLVIISSKGEAADLALRICKAILEADRRDMAGRN